MNIALRPVFTAQSQQKKKKKKKALIIKVAPRHKTNNLFVDSTLKKRNIKENLFKIRLCVRELKMCSVQCCQEIMCKVKALFS